MNDYRKYNNKIINALKRNKKTSLTEVNTYFCRCDAFQTVGVVPSISRNFLINWVELWNPLLAAT